VQVDFIFDAYEEIKSDEPLSFLEVACGPAQHSLEMAESKLTVFCVDNNAHMLEYARELATADDLRITALDADMRSFSLPVRTPVLD
jgi:ubiquinone/menaquinone biosynthesis C-methylase UbiE